MNAYLISGLWPIITCCYWPLHNSNNEHKTNILIKTNFISTLALSHLIKPCTVKFTHPVRQCIPQAAQLVHMLTKPARICDVIVIISRSPSAFPFVHLYTKCQLTIPHRNNPQTSQKIIHQIILITRRRRKEKTLQRFDKTIRSQAEHPKQPP